MEPGSVFKEYDLRIVQSLQIPLFQMSAVSVNYWLTKFVQEVAKPSKERYPPKTLYQIVCGLPRFMEEKNEKMDFNPVFLLYTVLIIYSEIEIVYFYLGLSFCVLQVLNHPTRSACKIKEGTRLGIG